MQNLKKKTLFPLYIYILINNNFFKFKRNNDIIKLQILLLIYLIYRACVPFIVNILRPKWLESLQCQATVSCCRWSVHHCRIPNLIHADAWVVAKVPEHAMTYSVALLLSNMWLDPAAMSLISIMSGSHSAAAWAHRVKHEII